MKRKGTMWGSGLPRVEMFYSVPYSFCHTFRTNRDSSMTEVSLRREGSPRSPPANIGSLKDYKGLKLHHEVLNQLKIEYKEE